MKKLLIDFSKVLSPIGISRFIAGNLAPYLSLSEQEIREKYKNHITDLVLGTYSIQSLVQEYLPYLSLEYDEAFLYQKFLEIPPINADFITFLQKRKQAHKIQYYLVSDLYPALGEQLETQFGTLFDKYLFSYKIGQKKSDPLFRETIQEDEMSLFIDDKQNNLNQAKKYGIPGYLFTSFDVLLQDWNTIWIQITGIPKKS